MAVIAYQKALYECWVLMLFFVMSCDYVCRTYMHVSISSRHVYYYKQLRFCQQPVASTHLGQRKNSPRRYQQQLSVPLIESHYTHWRKPYQIGCLRFIETYIRKALNFGWPDIQSVCSVYAPWPAHKWSAPSHAPLTSAHRRLKGFRMGALNNRTVFSVCVHIVYFDSIYWKFRYC